MRDDHHDTRPSDATSGTGQARSASREEAKSLLPSIAAPKGGGAMRGIGEKFSANPVTGTGAMTIPLALSPGRAGFGPQLSLSYDSGSGNGPFGFGWSLSMPQISRKTDKGLPHYDDARESDVFLLSGVEDLVPMLDPAGLRHQDSDSHPGFLIERYRPRVEGGFARIERWTERATGDVHWRTVSPDNVTTLYGRDNSARIFDPDEASAPHPRRIFAWLISASFDAFGNAISYEYAAEDDVRVNRTRLNERNRARTANRYLKRVKHGNRQSRLAANVDLADGPGLASWLAATEWLFEAVFDYDEDHCAPLPLDPTRAEDEQHAFFQACVDSSGLWAVRPDPFSVYRAGFEVRTYRRCRRVLMFHRFSELGPEPCLVRDTAFDYDDLDGIDDTPTQEGGVARQGSTRYGSFLRRVVRSGYVRDTTRPIARRGGRAYATYLQSALPPLAFEYSQAKIHDEVRTLDAASLENLPLGVDGGDYQWVDLDGEGLTGVLTRREGAWHYKPNLGDGRFGPSQTLHTQPPRFAQAAGAERLLDLDGNGQLDVVAFDGLTPGFYERTADFDWEPFRTFHQLPNLRWDDPNTRFIDLSGDGHADVLITEHEVFTWYRSLARDGFDAAQHVRKAWDEEQGPSLVFADGTQSIHLADMSGDGLTDLVRVKNGEVCYWPNLGYGRFGAKVSMDDAPWFDHPEQFSQARLRLADIDGSGTIDLIYLAQDGAHLYFNQAGNGWSPARKLRAFFPIDALTSVTTADLLGQGTACLVWSSPLPADARSPLRYIDLMGAQKPHLLVRSNNNLGAETHIRYAPSTKFYLEDKRAGRPWITRIPFPVHVVERVEVDDHISQSRFVTRYAYHHGCFDGHEREFRGFGLVEQYDTEAYATLSADGQAPTSANIEASSHVPPILTKTWFHTGVSPEHARSGAGMRGAHDAGEYFREPGLSDARARELRLSDTHSPAGLTTDEAREACRALRGAMLRQEVYALDGGERSALPYAVTERSYGVKRIQGRGDNRHAVFLAHPGEELAYSYERALVPVSGTQRVDDATAATSTDITWRLDPRVSHALTLEVDAFGNALKTVSVGYGRRFVDPALPQQVQDEQAKTHITYTEQDLTRAIDDATAYRTPLAYEDRAYELTGYTPTGAAGRFRAEDFVRPRLDDPSAVDASFDEQLSFEARPSQGRQRRLIAHAKALFRRDDLEGPLPLGQLEPLALPYERYQLALTPGLIQNIFNDDGALSRVHDAMLDGAGTTSGGYVHSPDASGALDAGWWVPSGRIFYSPGQGDTASQELEHARAHFFLPHRARDPLHTADARAESFIAYDRYDLLVSETRDALDNRVTVGERHVDPTQPLVAQGQDYRTLQPALVMDPNRNRTAVAFDALGMAAGFALMGKPEDLPALGDQITDAFRADLTRAERDALFADPRGPIAAQLLASASSRIVYELSATLGDTPLANTRPACAATIARETHVSALSAPADLRLHVSLSYSDGFGREIQQKVQAEPGPVPVRDASGDILLNEDNQPTLTSHSVSTRWLCSGWTVFNNKGAPVRQYEPHFTDTHRFELDVRIGQSPILLYDPLGRVVATLHPNHTWEKVVFSPWHATAWDASDTVLIDAPQADADVGDLIARQRPEAYLPTWHALRADPTHATTLAARYPDAILRANEQAAAQQSALYAQTPSVAHADSLGRTIATVSHNRIKYSDAAQAVTEHAMTRVVLDVQGQQREVIDAKGRIVVRYAYDLLGNRIHQASMEAGARWALSDIAGKPLYAWDSRGHRSRTEYDVLQRPRASFLREDDGPEVLVGRHVYGESRVNPETDNLRGQVIALYDQAGVITTDRYDFKGNLLRSARQLVDTVQINGLQQPAYKHRVDWDSPVTLAPQRYVSQTRFDALSRPTQLIAPHSDEAGSHINILQPHYNEANLLERVDVWLDHGDVPSALIEPATRAPAPVGVAYIDYDAKAQRQRVDYKNGVSTRYSYDRQTRRLVHLRTQEGSTGRLLQNLHYSFDVAGNITHIRDTAQQAVFFANARVAPGAHYTYDALSRLIEATGREHLGQMGGAPLPHTYDDAGRTALSHPNDGQALGSYLERYLYDQVGNLEVMRHVGAQPQHPGWTRRYSYEEPSQLEPDKVSNRLTRTTLGNGAPVTARYSDGGDGYDAHGNMLKMPQLHLMRWNERDQLQMTQRQAVSASDADGVERSGERTWYVYDGGGQRVRKVTELANGQIKDERFYLGGFEVYRKPSDGLVRETLHIMDDTQRIALVETRTRGDEPGIPRELIRYQLSNHLGSACLEVDDQARVLSYEEYTPYGSTAYQAVRSQVQTPKRYRFTGMERDEESGLSYHAARYYAPWLGRWASCDPAGHVDGPNLYQYVSSKPLRLIDPSGLSGLERVFGGLKVVGGAIEIAIGGAMMSGGVATSGVGVGIPVAAAGGFVTAHGVDTVVSGALTIVKGTPVDTFTSHALQAMGVGRKEANMADAAIGIVGTAGTYAIPKAITGGRNSVIVAFRPARGVGHNKVGVTTKSETTWTHLEINNGVKFGKPIQPNQNPSIATGGDASVVTTTAPSASYKAVRVPVSAKQAEAAANVAKAAAAQSSNGKYLLGCNDCATHTASVMRAASIPTSPITTPSLNLAAAALRDANIINKLAAAGETIGIVTFSKAALSEETPPSTASTKPETLQSSLETHNNTYNKNMSYIDIDSYTPTTTEIQAQSSLPSEMRHK